MAERVKPFEKIFPYLSYRWRYDDGEYSPYAPFTEVQFLSVVSTDDKERFKNGFNVFMTNDLEEITINSLPTGREDVVAVDILYTESISTTIYVLKTIEIAPRDRGSGFLYDIKIPRRSLGAALPNAQLNRHFDSVPLKAKAQEITANRLMYGNYVYKFDQDRKQIGDDGFKLKVNTSKIVGAKDGPSVRTNRTYEVGVVYIDKYGRQGSLLTQQTKLPDSPGSSFKTNFTYTSRIKLNARILSDCPDWAVAYRYFIKDTSNTTYNLTAYNTYIEGDQSDLEQANAYLQFDSKDRNKVTEDTFLIPRRSTFENADGDVLTSLFRIPILDIENEAPDIVKQQVGERNVAGITTVPEQNATVVNASKVTTATTLNQTVFYLKINSNFNLSSINAHIQAQDNTQPSLAFAGSGIQTVDCTGFSERIVTKFTPTPGGANTNISNYQTAYCLIDEIQLSNGGASNREVMKITVSNRVDDTGAIISGTGISKAGITMANEANAHLNIKFSKLALTEEGQDKLKGSFFVKVPRDFVDPPSGAAFKSIPIGQTTFLDNGEVETVKSLDFETEALDESNLDLYWESAGTFSKAEHGQLNIINWSNCIARIGDYPGKIYLESTQLLDKFNSTELVKSIRVNTPDARFAQEHRKAGIIFSGLYNSRTGLNELNQFSLVEGIQKELEPNYGGIQKLYTLDTNLLALAEDKVFRILADKDALFNADEGVNVTATNLVLGQAMVYQGQYGISTHPESFAFYGNNAYFTDAKRGAVMQLTPANGQLFPISSRGMSNFWRDRIGTADKLIGAYDGAKMQYVLSMQGYDQNAASIGSETIPNETSNITLGYSLRSEGWTSRFSFIPESGITMANKFYTFKNGKAYLHNSDTADRNNFYGTAANSEVQIIFNDNPTYISDFLTLNYEGDSNWEASEIIGDQDGIYSITNVRILDSDESGFLGWFLKEGKYHGSIVGTQPVYIIDPNGSVGADGFWPLIQDGANTQDISGTKGFFSKVRFKNSATTKKELFAISSEYYISQT